MLLFKPTVHGRKSRYWYAKIRDPKSKKWIKVALGVEDKQAAEKIAREKQREKEQIAAGLINPAHKDGIATHLLSPA